MTTKQILVSTLLALAAVICLPLAVRAESPVLVLNAANPASSIQKSELLLIYLGKKARWSDGVPIRSVDQVASNPIRESFSRELLGRQVSAYKSYWQRMIFSGRGTPPVELRSDREVLEFVRENRGAVGYVRPGTPLGDRVKTLRLAD